MSQTALAAAIEQLQQFTAHTPRLLVLTGAGISVSSGIPTYRDQDGIWLRGEPIRHPEFIASEKARRRYWARSLVGWPLMARAKPNPAHHALHALEQAGHVALLVTQNVDNLHQQAGTQRIVDLHGNLHRVRCLSCRQLSSRVVLQQRLQALNQTLMDNSQAIQVRPDGDAELAEPYVEAMRIPECAHCQGVLMPDVIFFGGTLPGERVAYCLDALQQADALLVVGSSLQVYSGYRFCLKAQQWGKPIALLNPGKTRADDLATLHIKQACEPVLTGFSQRINAALGE